MRERSVGPIPATVNVELQAITEVKAVKIPPLARQSWQKHWRRSAKLWWYVSPQAFHGNLSKEFWESGCAGGD